MYYDALITAWNSPVQPPAGVTGTGLTPQMSEQQKLDAINAWTIVGAVPTTMHVTADQVFNCVNWAEFAVLTAAQQQNVLLMCAVPGLLLGGSANVAYMLPGMLVAYFPVAGVTIANLTALAKAVVQSWCLVNGYSTLSHQDLVAAGLA